MLLHGENAMELEFMVEMGMKNRDAIHASTASAAALMRLKDHGRLADGMMADILVVNGDPMADIKMVARKENHRLVIKRGQIARDNRAKGTAGAGGLAIAAL